MCACECKSLWKPEVLAPLELQLQVTINHPPVAPGTKLRSPGRAVHALKRWAISPALHTLFFSFLNPPTAESWREQHLWGDLQISVCGENQKPVPSRGSWERSIPGG